MKYEFSGIELYFSCPQYKENGGILYIQIGV